MLLVYTGIAPTTYAHLINECFYHKTNFSQSSQLLFMFQCDEHVKMNKFFCSSACTWMTIIDSQLYIIDSLSLDVLLEKMLTWWLPCCHLTH